MVSDIDIIAPTVAITTPSTGVQLSGTISVTATATDNVGVSRVEFHVDGGLIFTDTTSPYTWSWNTTTATNGSHTLMARAYDPSGNIGESALVSVMVSDIDLTVPTVGISSPSAGAVLSGTISVTATATDNVGVNRVEFYVDGGLTFTDFNSPYLWSWDTTMASDGVHTLLAKAYDTSGNVGDSSLVSVTVINFEEIYNEQDPLTFTGGWGWDGFQGSRTSTTAYTGSYSYAVTIPSGRTDSSEGWTGPLPDSTGAERLVFAYKKSNPSSNMVLYFFVNGYWHEINDTAGHYFQGWNVSRYNDTNWHEVVINLSTETQGTGGNPDVSPLGQLSNFEIAVTGGSSGNTIYFDKIQFEKVHPVVSLYDEQDPSTFTGGWGWDGFQGSRTSTMAYKGSYSYSVTIPSGRTDSSEG